MPEQSDNRRPKKSGARHRARKRAVDVLYEAELRGRGTLDLLRERLAGFKLPKDLVHVEELPRNASGKVVKGTLRSEHGSVGV